jgi:hypothetical protein
VVWLGGRYRTAPLVVDSTAVAGEIGAQILSVYQQFRRGGAEVAKDYFRAMPYEPPLIEQDRRARYELK